MTTVLPPFSGDRPTCAKCGHVGARVEWSHEWKKCIAPKPDWCPGMEIGERLCRECGRCGYHWDEATAVPPNPAWSLSDANLLLGETERMLAVQGFTVRLGPHDRLTAVKFETIKEQQ